MVAPERDTVNNLVQGGVTSVIALYFYNTLQIMIPFLILTLVLVIVDLYFGVHASRVRFDKTGKEEDRVKPSRAFRKTLNKVFEYICWVILAASLSVTFEQGWINVVVMALVVGNEFISVLDNYLFVHGKKVTGLGSAILKVLGKKVGQDLSDIKIEELKDTEK